MASRESDFALHQFGPARDSQRRKKCLGYSDGLFASSSLGILRTSCPDPKATRNPAAAIVSLSKYSRKHLETREGFPRPRASSTGSKPVCSSGLLSMGKECPIRIGASDETLQEFRREQHRDLGRDPISEFNRMQKVCISAEHHSITMGCGNSNSLGGGEKPIQYFGFVVVTGGRFLERSGRGAGFHKRIF